ncbi:hypothetical protein VTI28DRAFT_2132 [Corynascus sepedonium]
MKATTLAQQLQVLAHDESVLPPAPLSSDSIAKATHQTLSNDPAAPQFLSDEVVDLLALRRHIQQAHCYSHYGYHEYAAVERELIERERRVDSEIATARRELVILEKEAQLKQLQLVISSYRSKRPRLASATESFRAGTKPEPSRLTRSPCPKINPRLGTDAAPGDVLVRHGTPTEKEEPRFTEAQVRVTCFQSGGIVVGNIPEHFMHEEAGGYRVGGGVCRYG